MKKYLLGLLALTISATVSATPYYEEFTDNVFLNSSNTSHTWTFDLDNDALFAGWNLLGGPFGTADINAEDTVDSAYFSIGFYDDFLNDGWSFANEYGGLTVDGSTWLSNEEIGAGDSIILADVSALLVDHILSVTVSRNQGDFGVSFTSLAGEFTDNPAAVPEPGSLALLGLGLAGLGFSRRKTKL